MAPRAHVSLRINPRAQEWAEQTALALTQELGRHVFAAEVLRTAIAVGKAHEDAVVRKIRSTA